MFRLRPASRIRRRRAIRPSASARLQQGNPRRQAAMSMKLWYSPASPFVRKVLVFAHETGLADSIELVPGDVWAPDTGDHPGQSAGKGAGPDQRRTASLPGPIFAASTSIPCTPGPRLIPSEPRRALAACCSCTRSRTASSKPRSPASSNSCAGRRNSSTRACSTGSAQRSSARSTGSRSMALPQRRHRRRLRSAAPWAISIFACRNCNGATAARP